MSLILKSWLTLSTSLVAKTAKYWRLSNRHLEEELHQKWPIFVFFFFCSNMWIHTWHNRTPRTWRRKAFSWYIFEEKRKSYSWWGKNENELRFLSLAYLGLVDFHLVFLSSIQDLQSFDLYLIEIKSIEIIIVLIRILWLSWTEAGTTVIIGLLSFCELITGAEGWQVDLRLLMQPLSRIKDQGSRI